MRGATSAIGITPTLSETGLPDSPPLSSSPPPPQAPSNPAQATTASTMKRFFMTSLSLATTGRGGLYQFF
jgi:hypothetical protein